MDDVLELTPLDELRASVNHLLSAAVETDQKAETLDWRIVDLARDMCRSAGHDPDLRVLDTQNAQRGPLGSTLVHATVPAWTLYIEAAQNVRGALNG